MIDLHTHSSASDGVLSPTELVVAARSAKLSALALTDHDTVSGLGEFMSAESGGMELIPGVELAAEGMGGETHIIGLFIDPADSGLLDFLERRRVDRRNRNEEIRRRLTALGYPLTKDEPEFAAISDSSSIGRPHFARALIRKFGFQTQQEVFDQLLGHSRPAYVRRALPPVAAAIAVIHSCGGIAVWAHPLPCGAGNDWQYARRACRRMARKGLDAMECFYNSYSPRENELLSEMARFNGLARSGGSDFHSPSPDRRLGIARCGTPVPDDLLVELKSRLEERRKALFT
ncbi:MAG: PHP domain-containing protein [Victivallaceae bacterium]|nr:PHP domain-containing protein [Victivallaceae bacterium]